MDAGRKQNYNQREYYMQGNTARKLQVVPRYPDEEEQVYIERPVRRVRRKPKVQSGLDIFSLFILSAAIFITLYTCVGYLKVQSNITGMNSQIAVLESDLTKLQNENRNSLSQINTNLDLNYIYKVATNELGMVYPKNNQVITYDSNPSDYVRQYKDIPEENKDTLLDKLLK